VVLKIADRSSIAPFIVMDVMSAANERAAAGLDVLHLEVGQPSTPAPARVIEAAKQALDGNLLGYTESLGIMPLRERIARHYQDQYGVDADPRHIVITTGSSGGFLLSFLSAFDPGDKVGITSPGYPAYRNILRAVGVEAIDIPVGPNTHFQPTADMVTDPALGLDGMIVASPSNPTGSMLPAGTLGDIVAACQEKGIRFVSDEIYHGITFGRAAETALAHSKDVFVINSFSKYFSMTGWRLGWMVVPEDLVRAIERLSQNLFISPPTLSQLAALSVFDCADELDANVRRYDENRRLLLAELPKAGLDKLAPADGAFYVYADVGKFTDDSVAFCKRLLAETGIAATPGIDFDPERGNRFIRFSIAGSTEDMTEAAKRLANWLK
jgi:aspartate/methionine/tyrosine aminotransferase